MDKHDFIKMIYEENRGFIASIIRSQLYSKCPHDVSDCVQDVFNAAFKNQNIQTHGNVKGWLCDTAKNFVKQYNARYLKVNNKKREIEDCDIIVEDFSEQVIEDNLFKEAVEKGVIDKAVESLSFSERDFYDLRYIKKLSYKEISAIMGKSESALNAKNTRLKRKIHDFLKIFLKNM